MALYLHALSSLHGMVLIKHRDKFKSSPFVGKVVMKVGGRNWYRIFGFCHHTAPSYQLSSYHEVQLSSCDSL
jgi:hypothetical protein